MDKAAHRAVWYAVAADVGSGGLQGVVVNVNSNDLRAAKDMPRNGEYATARAKVKKGLRSSMNITCLLMLQNSRHEEPSLVRRSEQERTCKGSLLHVVHRPSRLQQRS